MSNRMYCPRCEVEWNDEIRCWSCGKKGRSGWLPHIPATAGRVDEIRITSPAQRKEAREVSFSPVPRTS